MLALASAACRPAGRYGICFHLLHQHQPCHLSSLTHPVVLFGSLLLLILFFFPALPIFHPASSASALHPGLLFLPVLCFQFSASITSVIFTARGMMCQVKGRGSRHRQGTWGWSWTWQMPLPLLPLPQGQAHPRMGLPPLPLQVDTKPSAYFVWSRSQWLHESRELVLSTRRRRILQACASQHSQSLVPIMAIMRLQVQWLTI